MSAVAKTPSSVLQKPASSVHSPEEFGHLLIAREPPEQYDFIRSARGRPYCPKRSDPVPNQPPVYLQATVGAKNQDDFDFRYGVPIFSQQGSASITELNFGMGGFQTKSFYNKSVDYVVRVVEDSNGYGFGGGDLCYPLKAVQFEFNSVSGEAVNDPQHTYLKGGREDSAPMRPDRFLERLQSSGVITRGSQVTLNAWGLGESEADRTLLQSTADRLGIEIRAQHGRGILQGKDRVFKPRP